MTFIRENLEIVERRLELVRRLFLLDGEWRRSFVAMELASCESISAEQARLGLQIEQLESRLRNPLEPRSEAVADPTELHRMRSALDDTASLYAALISSNAVRKSILKRSKVTIDSLRNLFNSHASVYAMPAAPSSGKIYEEHV